MGWFKNAVGRVGDFIGELFAPSKSNNEQHVGWNIVLPTATTKTYTYDNSNESPLTKANDPLYKIQQDIADATAVATAYGITIPEVSTDATQGTLSTSTPSTEVTTGAGKLYFPIDSGYAKKAYDERLAAIEEQRAYAEKLAEQARQEAIKNAYVNYDRSLSTYGQNAERLAQMGLSNSGYGDYLNGVAYSSMVGGVQDAHKTANEAIQNAYYNASQLKADAADAYYNRLIQQQQQADTKFEKILEGANYGEYTADQVQSLAKIYGFTDEQTNALVKAINAYEAYMKEYENSINNFFKDEEDAS